MNAATKPSAALSGPARRSAMTAPQHDVPLPPDGVQPPAAALGSRLASCQQRPPRAVQASAANVGCATGSGLAVAGSTTTALLSGKENRGPTAAGFISAAAAQSADCTVDDQGRWQGLPTGETVKQQAPSIHKVSASRVGDAYDPNATPKRHGLGGSTADIDSPHVVDAFGFMTGSLLPPTISPWKMQPSEASGGRNAGWNTEAPSSGAGGGGSSSSHPASDDAVASGGRGRPVSGASPRWIQVTSRVLEAREAKVAKLEQHCSDFTVGCSGSGNGSAHRPDDNCQAVAAAAAAPAAAAAVAISSIRGGTPGYGTSEATSPVSVRSIVSAFERPTAVAAQKFPVALARHASPEFPTAAAAAAAGVAPGASAKGSAADVPSAVRQSVRTSSGNLLAANEAPSRSVAGPPTTDGREATVATTTASFLAAGDDNCRRRELDSRLSKHLSWYEQTETAAAAAADVRSAALSSRVGGGAVSCSRRPFVSRDDAAATIASSSSAAVAVNSSGRSASSLSRTLSFAGSTTFTSSAARGFARQRQTELGRIAADAEERVSNGNGHSELNRWAPNSAAVAIRELPGKRAALGVSDQHKAQLQPSTSHEDCSAQFNDPDHNGPAESRAGGFDLRSSIAYPQRGGQRTLHREELGVSSHPNSTSYSLPASSGDGGCSDDVDDHSSTATSSSCCSSFDCQDGTLCDAGCRRSASPVAYLLDAGDGQQWPNQRQLAAEQSLTRSISSTVQNGSWQPQLQLSRPPFGRDKAADSWSNDRSSAIGGNTFNESNGSSANGANCGGGGGGTSEGSTRRLKRAVSTNILPSRNPAVSAAGATSHGTSGNPAGSGRQQQHPLQCQSTISSASPRNVTLREAQLNDYNERRSCTEVATSSPVTEDAPSLPPRAASNQSSHHQQAAIIAAHQHFHSMGSLGPAEQRTVFTNDDHRSSSYRPPQPTTEFRSRDSFIAADRAAAAHSQSPIDSQQPAASQSRQRVSAGIRRVESYRVVPTSAASAAAADRSLGNRHEERDRSKQEIRQSLLDFYKQKTGNPADGRTGSPSAQDIRRDDSDSPPLSAPAHLLAKHSPPRSSRDFGMPWSRFSVASNGNLSVESDVKHAGTCRSVQLRRSGSFSSVAADRGASGSDVDGQRTVVVQGAASGNRNADSRGHWSTPLLVDGKPAVSSLQSESNGGISSRVKKLPVAEVSPFSRTTTFTSEAESVTGTTSCEPHSNSDSGPLPPSATVTPPRKVGNVYTPSSSDSSYNLYNGPPSPGSPPVLPPRNYRLSTNETEAKTTKTASYDISRSGYSPTSSEKIFDGQPTAVPYPGVRLRNKPVPVPLPADAFDRLSGTAGDDLDSDYREQLRRASASQYKRASLSAASTSSQLSSPGASSPANRKSVHIDGDAEPTVTYRHGGSSGGSRPSSGVFRVDEPRQRWSCEASQLMPPPLPVSRYAEHVRQGSLSCASPGFSSRSPVTDEVFSARSSPLATDEPTAAQVSAVSLLSVTRSGREKPEAARGEPALPTPSSDLHSHRRSNSVSVETPPSYGLSHTASISSVHSHSTSMLRADLEVAAVLQPSPVDVVAEPRLNGVVGAAGNSCMDASRSKSGFKTISMEIMENLKGLGISVSEKRFAEDIADGESKPESTSATPPEAAAPTDDIDGIGSNRVELVPAVVHVRQKSQEEILCDSKMQILAQSIEGDDAAVSRVLAPPEGFRQASDYLSGVFDDLLLREQQRKARRSSCGAADKTGSSASPASLECDSSSRESPACDSGIYCQQSPCAVVTHSRRLPSVGGDCDSASVRTRLHEWLQNQDYCCSSPNSADSKKKKDELVSILRRKLELLRAEKETREVALKQNESAGEAVAAAVVDKCSERDASKYRSYVDDLDKITKLLLKLSRRLARAENDLRAAEALATGDGRRSSDEQQKAAAEQRRDSLRRQHDDALLLKEGIDRQRKTVSSSLQSCLSAEQYEQYEAFVVAKVALTMEHADVEDRIAFGEEQLAVLEKLATTLPSPVSSPPLADA